MVTISQENDVVTLINVFTVEPQNQQKLVDILVEATESTMQHLPGFVSANIHRSLDGVRVVNYAQWRRKEDFEAMMKNPLAGEHMKPILEISKPDFHLYEVAYTQNNEGLTTIQEGSEVAAFINHIKTAPENQQKLLDFVIQNDKGAFSSHAGYRSANFHRSLDGERIVNYSHWDKEASFLEAIRNLLGDQNIDMERANQMATAGTKGLGKADFRFYEVVSSHEAKEFSARKGA